MSLPESFEEPLVELRRKIEELEGYPEGAGHGRELQRLRRELRKRTGEVYRDLTPGQTTRVARQLVASVLSSSGSMSSSDGPVPSAAAGHGAVSV